MTNISNNMSFSFIDSKNQSPTNASSQEIPKTFIPPRSHDEKVLSDYPKFEYSDYGNYKDYMNSMDPKEPYEENLHFNEDYEYNTNSNLFNFDEYFTVN